MVCPANSWKATPGGARQVHLQHKLSNKNKNLNYQKALQIALKMNKTQKLSDLINTALSDLQCIKTRSHGLLNDNTEKKKSRH